MGGTTRRDPVDDRASERACAPAPHTLVIAGALARPTPKIAALARRPGLALLVGFVLAGLLPAGFSGAVADAAPPVPLPTVPGGTATPEPSARDRPEGDRPEEQRPGEQRPERQREGAEPTEPGEAREGSEDRDEVDESALTREERREARRQRARERSRSERYERILRTIRAGVLSAGAEHVWIEQHELEDGRQEAVFIATGDVTTASRDFTLQADDVVVWIDTSEQASGDERGADEKGAEERGGTRRGDTEARRRTDEGRGEETDADETDADADADEAESDELGSDTGLEFDTPIESVRQIYAEGDVIFTTGDEVLRAERLIYDLENEEIVVVDGWFKTFAETERRGRIRRVPVYLRADAIRKIANEVEAEDAYIGSCGYGRDLFHVRAEEIELDLADEERGVSDTTFRVRDAVASAWGVPVLWLPRFRGIGDLNSFYFQRARAGVSSQFGVFLQTEWGDDIKIGAPGDRRKIGDWTVHVDPYAKRGVGLGLDLDYKTTSGYGRFRSYYIHDQADEDRRGRVVDPDTGELTRPPIDNPDRARMRLQYRHFFPWEVEGTFEASWLSDSNFLREYFEREFKTGKEQETVAFFKKVVDDKHIFTLLQRNRLNDFQDQTEYLPEGAYQLIEEPVLPDLFLGTNLYYSTRSRIGNVRRRPSNEAPDIPEIDKTRLTRFDTVHRVSVPFTTGPLTFRPFFESDFSIFSDTRNDEGTENRFGAAGGASVATQFHRTYDVSNDLFELDGLRHIVNPIVTYRDRFANTVASDELIPIDDVEDRDKVEFFRLQLRNRFQTRRDREVIDWINFDTAINVFPEENRDNDGRTWGNLENDVIVRLTPKTFFFFESEWDWREDEFEILNTGFNSRLTRDLSVQATYREFQERETLTASFGIQLDEKWATRLFERYQFNDRDNQDFGIAFTRFGCDWVTEIAVAYDAGDDDTRLSLNLMPRALYRGPGRRQGVWDDELYGTDIDWIGDPYDIEEDPYADGRGPGPFGPPMPLDVPPEDG